MIRKKPPKNNSLNTTKDREIKGYIKKGGRTDALESFNQLLKRASRS